MKTTATYNASIEVYEDNGCGLRAYILEDGKPMSVEEYGEQGRASECADMYNDFVACNIDLTMLRDTGNYDGITREDVIHMYNDDVENSVLVAEANYIGCAIITEDTYEPEGYNGAEFLAALK